MSRTGNCCPERRGATIWQSPRTHAPAQCSTFAFKPRARYWQPAPRPAMCASTDAVARHIRYRWRGILAAALVAVAVTASADPLPTIMTITVHEQRRRDHFVMKDGHRWLL